MTPATPTSNMIKGRVRLKVDKPYPSWPLLRRLCMETKDTNRESVPASLSVILNNLFKLVLFRKRAISKYVSNFTRRKSIAGAYR